MSNPNPIALEPSGDFLGSDGSWSTFEIGVGVPAQKVQVIPSSQISQTLVAIPEGCTEDDASNCTQARGGVFDGTKSENWTPKGNFTLNIETNLGSTYVTDSGTFGYDTLALSTANGENTTLESQLLSGIATKDFFVGSLGLSQTPLSFKDPAGQAPDVRPSLITSLKNENLIPSLSYGYTAGAFYRNQTASLTIGGIDASRFVPNDVSIPIKSNPLRQLVVALKSITFSEPDSDSAQVLSETGAIVTLVDSTVPEIWLPREACQAFESAFGIIFDQLSTKYLVNSTIHDNLIKQNASVTFEIGSDVDSGSSVNITLPYKSFDQELKVGFPDSGIRTLPTKYFPLRRAADDTQYTLGRTFLQEAFLTVDYGSNNFSISQVIHSPASPQIVAIEATNTTGTASAPTGTITAGTGPSIVKTVNHNSGFPIGGIVGIVVALVLLALGAGGWFLWRKRKFPWRKRKSSYPNRPELRGDDPPSQNHENTDGHGPESATEKKELAATEYSVQGMESPRLEMGDDRITFEGYYGPNKHGHAMELPTEVPPRSELSSPEPISRQASPTPTDYAELQSSDPPFFTPEMASPSQSPFHPHEPLSALSSPRLPPSRPSMYRRSAQERVSSTSDESGFMPIQHPSSHYGRDGAPLRALPRRSSDDTTTTTDTYLPRRPSQLRKDSTESGLTVNTLPIHGQRPAHHRMDSCDSDPLHSPQPLAEEEETDSETHLMDGEGVREAHTQQIVRRGSAQLINQPAPSPPASPGFPRIARKEVAGGKQRQRSMSRGSRFEERFEGEDGRRS